VNALEHVQRALLGSRRRAETSLHAFQAMHASEVKKTNETGTHTMPSCNSTSKAYHPKQSCCFLHSATSHLGFFRCTSLRAMAAQQKPQSCTPSFCAVHDLVSWAFCEQLRNKWSRDWHIVLLPLVRPSILRNRRIFDWLWGMLRKHGQIRKATLTWGGRA
jgi:hypothetical protein